MYQRLKQFHSCLKSASTSIYSMILQLGTLPLISYPFSDDKLLRLPKWVMPQMELAKSSVHGIPHFSNMSGSGTQQARSISIRGVGNVDWCSQVCFQFFVFVLQLILLYSEHVISRLNVDDILSRLDDPLSHHLPLEWLMRLHAWQWVRSHVPVDHGYSMSSLSVFYSRSFVAP